MMGSITYLEYQNMPMKLGLALYHFETYDFQAQYWVLFLKNNKLLK